MKIWRDTLVLKEKFLGAPVYLWAMPSGENDRHTAWINSLYTDNLDEMLNQLYKPGRPLDTHFLYLNITRISYKRRNNPQMRALFKKTATEHISQFGSFVSPLRKLCKTSEGSVLPSVKTFQLLATVYTEDGEYEKAIEVCDKAIRLGLHDGTKGDYQARIERIKKKAAQQGIKISYEAPASNNNEGKGHDEDDPEDTEKSTRAKIERQLEILEGEQGDEARDAEIARLYQKANQKPPKKETHGWRKWLGF
jgi:hypothetical protein